MTNLFMSASTTIMPSSSATTTTTTTGPPSVSKKKKGWIVNVIVTLIAAAIIGITFGTIATILGTGAYVDNSDDVNKSDGDVQHHEVSKKAEEEQQQQSQQKIVSLLRRKLNHAPPAPAGPPMIVSSSSSRSMTSTGRYNPMKTVYRYYYDDDDDYYDDDDWWGSDDDWWGSDDDWSSSSSSSLPKHGGHFYNPVPIETVVAIKGGIGGRSSRSIDSIRFNKCPPIITGGDIAEEGDAVLLPFTNTNAWRYEHELSREYANQGVHPNIFPLLPEDYPIRGETARILKWETMGDSVVVPGDFQLHGATAADYLSLLRPPRFPSSDPKDLLFWDELRHVIQVQIARRNNKSPNSFNRWPASWVADNKSLQDIADAVHGEYPAFHQQQHIESLYKGGIEMNHEMFPFRSVVDFVGTEARISSLNTWAVEEVAAINFMLKWHIGLPRPEEIVWLIANGEFLAAGNDGNGVIPLDIVESIQSMKLEHAADFTAYREGSPMHPSWPAMHAAGSSCSFWLPALFKVTPEQYCESLRVDYAVAYGRTVAGVHYKQDNYAGLNIGQAIIKEKLPSHLAKKYGSDPAKVRAKLESLSFDWETFNPNDCTIDSVHVSERLSY